MYCNRLFTLTLSYESGVSSSAHGVGGGGGGCPGAAAACATLQLVQHSQKLQTTVQRQLQSGEGTWQQCQNSRLQRQHLNGTHYRCEEDYTDGTGCR